MKTHMGNSWWAFHRGQSVCVGGGGVMQRYELIDIQRLAKGTRVTRRCVLESSHCVLSECEELAGRSHLVFVVL